MIRLHLQLCTQIVTQMMLPVERSPGPGLQSSILMGFLAFLRLPNLSPHAISGFDHTRYLMGEYLFFTKRFVKGLIKWSKIMQNRDQFLRFTLPRLTQSLICPYRALKALYKLHPMYPNTSFFQIQASHLLISLMDSRVRKILKSINLTLGLSPTFYTFRRSGQVLLIPLMSQFKTLSAMRPGPLNVYGGT